MNNAFGLLFTPMKIGSLELKNRFVVPAMDSHYTNEKHEFTSQALNYYGERAKGGFGLIFTEFLCVSEEGLAEKTQAGIYDDRFLPGLSALTTRIHENGGRILLSFSTPVVCREKERAIKWQWDQAIYVIHAVLHRCVN